MLTNTVATTHSEEAPAESGSDPDSHMRGKRNMSRNDGERAMRELYTRVVIRNETTGETTRPETTVAIDWLGRGDPITVTRSVYDDNTWELLEEETERIEPPAQNETRTQVR